MKEEEKLSTTVNKPMIENDEIDLIEVAKTIWAGRKLIMKVTAVFFVIGLIIAFGSKVEYEASCTLLPESQEGMEPNLGGLGSLAGLAGINLDLGTSGVLTPELYPQIAKCTPFLLKAMNSQVHFEKMDTTTSSYLYFKDLDRPSILTYMFKYTVGIPFIIRELLSEKAEIQSNTNNSKSSMIRLSKEDVELLEAFKERITVDVDAKSEIITLTAEMPDAVAAAQIAQISVDLLTDYVTNYKVSKARENYDFIFGRFEETKSEFEKSQINLASFTDRNRNVVTSMAQAEFQRLQNEYNVNFEVYKGLATQLEQAKIKVKEETPVFTVLEPVQVPVEKSRPNKILILFGFIFLGAVLGLTIILIQQIKVYYNAKF